MSKHAPIRIGYDATLLRRNRITGIERYIVELLRELCRLVPDDYLVDVYCRPEGRDMLPALPHHFSAVVGPTDVRPASDNLWMPYVVSIRHPVLVHHPALAPGFITPRPFVLTIHDLTHRRFPADMSVGGRFYYRPLLEHAMASRRLIQILTVSKAIAAEIQDEYGVPASQVTVTPNGISPMFRPSNASSCEEAGRRYGLDRPYLLTVGTIEPRKNFAAAVRAFERVRASGCDVLLAVVGRRAWGDGLEISPTTMQHVRWLGYVPDHDLAPLYSGAVVFMFPSKYEGFGLPLAEAMACGAACVAADVPALREVGGDACRFAPWYDDAEMARQVEIISTNLEERKRLAAHAIQHVDQFRWARTAALTWASYEKLLHAHEKDGSRC